MQRNEFLPENISQNYRDLVRTGKETALHAAYRIGSQAKINLLLKHRANANALWLGDTVQDIERKYRLKTKTQFKIVQGRIHDDSEVETVKQCRLFLRKEETKSIVNSVCETMEIAEWFASVHLSRTS